MVTLSPLGERCKTYIQGLRDKKTIAKLGARDKEAALHGANAKEQMKETERSEAWCCHVGKQLVTNFKLNNNGAMKPTK